MRALVYLPSLHRVPRGAEVALEAIAEGLAVRGTDVTAIGSGPPRPETHYRYLRIPTVSRTRFERMPALPMLRTPEAYESLATTLPFLARYRPGRYDVTVTCGFPFENFSLRRPRIRGPRPKHVFVTQNGDWPARRDGGEFRFFGCDGLVCTNPDYYERHRDRYHATLIPNGFDTDRFRPGPGDRRALGLPDDDRPVVLMVSALIPSKRVLEAIRAVARLDDARLVVAGDGPQRTEVERLAAELLPGRFVRLTLPSHLMPSLYRCADVVLHTTLAESFGNVYVEAMATGLPVVAHDSVTTRWILGDDAVLVDTTDDEALVEGVRTALEQWTTSTERAVHAADRFSLSAVADQYDRFIREVVG